MANTKPPKRDQRDPGATAAKDATRGRQTTLKDIAQEVGVSINAVSSVLNPRKSGVRVSDATRRAIFQCARRLKYRRNVCASRLAGGSSRTLGILMARMGSPYDGPVASGFEQQAMRSGYRCLVGCLHSDRVEAAGYIEEFMAHGVEGLLLCTVWNHPSLKEALRSVVEAAMPLVFVDYAWEGVTAPLVCGDHLAGGRLIGEHLMQTGHRAIAIVENEHAPRVPSVESRVSGVCQVAHDHGAEVQTVHPPAGSRKQVGGHLARFLDQHPDVTALVCCNDVEAYSVILALNACGLAVPDDVAVTGYDDLTAALMEEIGMVDQECDAIMSTPVTTVRQPLRRIGEEAARLLIDWTEHGAAHSEERRVLDVELVVRASSRLPARATC